MSLHSVCIEVRKNLRCANVFLRFEKSLTETECLKINVDGDALRLCAADSMDVHIPMLPYLTVEARTMSNLTVEECNASFRLTVTSLREADFQQTQALTKPMKPQLLGDDSEACLHCSNCSCALMITSQAFQRVLEYPSGSIDVSEFFCHHGPDLGATLVPQISDLFYGFQFVVLNTELLRLNTLEKEAHLYCRRCLQYLGETLYDRRAAKLWTDTLRLKCSNNVDGFGEVFSCEQGVKPTYELLNKIINDCSAVEQPSPLLQQMQFSKVLLEASFPSRQRQYLLLHILEKQLPVLRNVQPFTQKQLQTVEAETQKQLHLTPFQCIKLLYRQMDAKPEGVGPKALLAAWRKDISIHSLQVSPTLFSALLAELEENTLLLPELYRYTREDFQLSYVF